MKYVFFFLLSFVSVLNAEVLTISTDSPENRNLKIYYRLPKKWNGDSRIMVLFGGRNWSGVETFARYRFETFADQHNLILLSPSFINDDYWEPEKWSGSALFSAIDILEKKLKLKRRKMLYYGFSAGGQCANLFYAYKPERVLAFGIHACGVYFDARKWKMHVPALITCGSGDAERFEISRNFIYQYRESGGTLLWKPFSTTHVLNSGHLKIAQCFFESVLNGEQIKFIGDDDSRLYYPVSEKEKVDVEFRNPLPEGALLQLWEKEK